MAPINKSLWIQQGTANAVLRLGYDALNYADVTVASTGAVSYGITGSVNTYTWGGQLVGPSGSAAAPSFSFVGNTSTGVYSDVAGTVKVAVGSQVGLKIEPAAVSGTDDGIQVGDVSMKLQSDIGRYYDQGLRVQATGTNQQAVLTVMPSGTSAASLLRLYNSSDPANTSAFGIEANGTTARIFITDFGTPTSLTNITYVAPAGGSHRWDVGTDDDAMFLTSNGVLTLGNEIRLPFGNATDPSYTFTSEGGTGMFGSAGVLGFSTAGVERLTISSTGVDVASGNLTVGAGIVIAGATAKISLDGPDGTVAAGSVGLAEKSGGLELSSRGNIKLFLDNDNDGAGHNFYIYSGTATSTTAVFKIDEAGAITAGTWDADVIASAYLDADTAHLSVAQTITGIKTFNTARTTIQQGTGSGDVDLFATGFHDGFAIGNNLRYSGGSSDPTLAANYTYIEAVGANTAGSLLFMRGNGGESGVSLEFYTAPASTGVGGAVATLTKRFGVTAGTMVYGGLTVSFAGAITATGLITATSGIDITGASQVLNHNTTDDRTKIRVWNSALYGLGMGNSYTFGGLNSYAMTFQMNNSTNRGWWWGHDGHTNGQGSMALTNTGLLTVAQGMRIGYGISDVTAPTAGAVDISGTLDVTGDATFNNTIRSNDGSHHNFVASNKTTDAASKAGSYAVAHYTNAEENVTLIRASAGATTNLVQIGGGSSLQNAATSVAVYAAATSTTTLGTAVATFSLTGVTVASGSLFVNTISERSAASGVTIDSVLLKDGGGTFSGLLNADGNIRVTGVAPTIDMWEDLDAPPDADEGYWRFVVSGGYMYLQTRTDVNGSGVDALKFSRTSGTTVNQLEVGSRLYVNSQDTVILRGKNLDDSVSATWPAGRVPNDLQWDQRISTSGNYEVRSVNGTGTVKNAMFIGHATGNVALTESLFVDTISQYTTLTGVTVDGVLLKDSEIFSAAWKGSTIDEFYLDAIVARKNATQTFTGVNEFTQRTTFSGDDLTIESTGDIASDLGCNSFSATTFLSSNLYFNGTPGSDNPATSENWTYHAGAGASQTGGMLLLMRANGTGRSFTGYSAPTNGVNPDTVLGAITFTTLFNFNNNGLQVRGGDATTPGYSFTGDSNTGMYSFGSNDIGFSCGGGVDFRITDTQIYAYNPIRMVGNGAQATPRFTFNNDGDTGMYLDGIGVLGFSTAGVERLTISSTGITVVGTGTATDWVTTSDMRLKDKVANLDGFQSLYKLGKLDAFTYTMKDDESLRVHLGLSAQQVREQFPEVVTEDASGNLAIAYGKLVPALIEALNHQEARIQELEAHG